MSNAEIVIHAFMTSRLDYCNVLLGGCSVRLINKLQLVQNAAARVHTTFTFTFNHLADAFIQSDVQMRRTIEAIRPSREQQYRSAMTSLS